MIFEPLTLANFRKKLGNTEALPQLIVLGLLSGLFTGLIILAFRFVITWPLEQFLPNYSAENFEALDSIWHFFLPIIGSALIALFLWRIHPDHIRVGVPHVLERLAYHQGKLPAVNAVVQFIGGALALLFGHSAGREGPAVHMGAASGSLLGQWLRLPNNCTRMLVGCGVAAAISASFNTPIAGVIFAMEVVMMEYTLIGFIPVIVASTTAAVLMQYTIGNETAFMIPAFELGTLSEIPFIIFMGAIIGLLALTFNRTVITTIHRVKWPLSARIMLAGLITGSVAVLSPHIMGMGYDTVSAILYGDVVFGDMGIKVLLLFLVAKLFVTATCIGLGVPMGLIGPTLVIGAAAGAALGLLGDSMTQVEISDIGFYAMLGMGAMMAAVLQAPLAAIMAVLELTQNSAVIFPAMAAVVTASVTCRYFFPHGSVFQAALIARGMDWRRAPVDHALEETNVTHCMNPLFSLQPATISIDKAVSIAQSEVDWIVITNDINQPENLIATTDVRIATEQEHSSRVDSQNEEVIEVIELNEIPGLRLQLAGISRLATLKDAKNLMDETLVEALFITDDISRREINLSSASLHKTPNILGILRRDDIVRFYTEPHQR